MNDPKAPTDGLKIDEIDALIELALNLALVLEPCSGRTLGRARKALWATTQNPWVILRTVFLRRRSRLRWAPRSFAGVSMIYSARIGNPIMQTHGSSTSTQAPRSLRSPTSA